MEMDILDALDEVRALNKKVENIYIYILGYIQTWLCVCNNNNTTLTARSSGPKCNSGGESKERKRAN